MMHIKKHLIVALAMALSLIAASAFAQTPVAGTIGVTVEEGKILAKGWSIKKDILGMDVYNDANEKVGTVEDIIVTPEKATSYAIVGVGGFLGMGKRDVAIPVNQFKMANKRIMLHGATKEALKNLPEFKYID
jgi:sporulation protein YlmC with PRC-barrel domain